VRTGRGFERLITFADAVVAIAMTLLVLPLVDIPGELADDAGVGAAFTQHGAEIRGFVISFVVIWALWTAHHRTMEYFRGYDAVILRLTLVWLFTIVVLPFTTQLLTGTRNDSGATTLYVGVLLVSSLCLVGMSWWGRRHRELLLADGSEVDDWVNEPLSIITASILLVALVLTAIWPGVGAWPLLALLLDDPVERLWFRVRRRRG
jgi:uncharacterized membrane protein